MNTQSKPIITLCVCAVLLVGLITGVVYVVMEGPAFFQKIFQSRPEENAINSQKEFVTQMFRALGMPEDTNRVSRETRNGKEYIRINIFELSNLCENHVEGTENTAYVMRGIVYKPPEFNQKDLFALARLLMWCCAADATAYAVRATYEDIDTFEEGTWVKAYGTLVRKSMGTSDSQPELIFKVDYLETIDEPSNPFITYWEEHEPFVY